MLFRKKKKLLSLGLISVITAGISISGVTGAPLNAAGAAFKVSGYVSPDFSYPTSSADSLKAGFKVEFPGTALSAETDKNGYFSVSGAPESFTGSKIKISKSGYLYREITDVNVKSDLVLSTAASPVGIWVGDMQNDGAINMTDIMEISKYFGTTSSDAKYKADYDVNLDTAINMTDIMTISKNFGRTPPDYPKHTIPTPENTNTPTPSKNTPTPTKSSGKYDYTDNRPASQKPPADLDVSKVPQFVSIGFDDNAYSGLPNTGGTGGMKWAVDFFGSLTNPKGSGNSDTYDGSQCHFTFYGSTINISHAVNEWPHYVKTAWNDAIVKGNEVGTHAQSHQTDIATSQAAWEDELKTSISWITKPYDPNETVEILDSTKGAGASKDQIFGFRAPFLYYNDNCFKAMKTVGLMYDCSIEEGWQSNMDGSNYNWPYTLDNASPGDKVVAEMTERSAIGKHPGIWEMCVHPVIVPPDNKCAQYGVPSGLRTKIKGNNKGFDTKSGKVTGLDYNLWYESKMTKSEFEATLKYTFDQRLNGNRCPFTFGAHSDEYSTKYTYPPNATAPERQKGMESFLNYVLSKPDARLVTVKQILDWVRNPSPLK